MEPNIANDDVLGLIGILICLIIAAFFAGAETAITSLGSLKTKHILNSKGRAARHLNLWLQYPNRVLTTILVFNTGILVLASAIATALAARYFQDNAVGIATGAMTFLVLIFGEILPKSFAKANSEKVGFISLWIIQLIYRLAYPLVWVLSEFASYIVKMLGSEDKNTPPITEEELEFLVNVGEKAGVLEDIKKEMISGVFEFDETKVREIITPRTDVIAIDANASIEDAVRVTLESGHSRMPVFEKKIDNVIGILFAKDLLKYTADGKNGQEVKVSKIMREPFFTPESKPIMEVFKDLKRTKNHMAIIIDEYGGTAGVVTMEDILEEIVGEIQDEFDVEEAQINEVEPGIYDCLGSMNVDEFMEFFELDKSLGEERQPDVDTIAGWLTQMLGHMPQVGQTLIIGPLSIEVTAAQKHRIRRLRVSRIHPQTSSDEEEITPDA